MESYAVSLAALIRRVDADAVERLASSTRCTPDTGGTTYTLDNDGSAATASHAASTWPRTPGDRMSMAMEKSVSRTLRDAGL